MSLHCAGELDALVSTASNQSFYSSCTAYASAARDVLCSQSQAADSVGSGILGQPPSPLSSMSEVVSIKQSSEPVQKKATKVRWIVLMVFIACVGVPVLLPLILVLAIIQVLVISCYYFYVVCRSYGAETHSTQLATCSENTTEELLGSFNTHGDYEQSIPLQFMQTADQDRGHAIQHEQILWNRLRDLEDKCVKLQENKTSIIQQQQNWEAAYTELSASNMLYRMWCTRDKEAECLQEIQNCKDSCSEVAKKIQEVKKETKTVTNKIKIARDQHPTFTQVSNSAEGFPFHIDILGSKIPQKARVEGELVGSNDQFNLQLNLYLMIWNKGKKIDPFSNTCGAQAQDILVQLANRIDEPFAVTPEEQERYTPRTIKGTVKVYFYKDTTLRIMRKVQTMDGNTYDWCEMIRFSDGQPRIASRSVHKISTKGAGETEASSAS